ncbi:MAG: transposase, partial [Candidatus Zambryskibacteria bacterium]|nr:transposase [Candidatus Zambryskibacteria bacterium]
TLLYLCNSDKAIHRSDLIKKSFLELMTTKRGNQLVEIGAYCLMPNHFHLLLRECGEGGISLFMQKLSTAYTMYFNKKYERTGALFQGRFKAEHLYNDNYLKYIFSYIHLNPISLLDKNWKEHKLKDKSKANKYLDSYSFSSYLDYANENSRIPEGNILNKSEFPKYFLTSEDFRSNIQEWIDYAATIVKVEP